MFVFVTGGSGYIGRRVIDQLVAAGHEVSALARSDEAEATVRQHGATEVVRGTLDDADVLREAAGKADAAIHLGSGGEDPAATDLAAATAIQEGLGDEKPYVHTGGLWVYGDTGGEEVDETAPFAPPQMTAWRVDNEREVLSRGHAVVVMPGVVYGDQAGIVRNVLWGENCVFCFGDGDNHWGLVHVADVADLYVRALEAPAGERYLGVTESLRQRDVCDATALAPGAPPRVTATTPEEAENKLGPLAEALLFDQQLSSDKARRELGWDPQHTDARAELRTGQA